MSCDKKEDDDRLNSNHRQTRTCQKVPVWPWSQSSPNTSSKSRWRLHQQFLLKLSNMWWINAIIDQKAKVWCSWLDIGWYVVLISSVEIWIFNIFWRRNKKGFGDVSSYLQRQQWAEVLWSRKELGCWRMNRLIYQLVTFSWKNLFIFRHEFTCLMFTPMAKH